MTLILKGQPVSTNQLYHQFRGRRFLTSRGKAVKDSYAMQVRFQYRGPVISKNIKVQMHIYFESARNDIDNAIKATMDCLTGLVWKDDRQVVELHAYKYKDKLNPRIEITVDPV